ncbi:FAD dependent oxidoreductase [Lasiosphaeria miniovina]|uniref:FAD dependent oxidoreductase n=1 Tax=Lasiosphaeria miniovina TaxID=1954250 RepID=A0AA40B617_9PEZI|nr:FAD dependent oxidoreductase [Lasiosphaeria miniovina]KAK0728384.1 FAD dependent oxidoreductase [Lasiosphaeria miniovina]
MDPPRKRIIVIIGGGVIGCTTAYFLTRHPKFDPELHTLILLEAASIAAGASGKAGGLLGLWAYPECLVPLSYRLHRELAGKHGGAERWGYRRLGCASVRAMVKSSDLKSRSEQKPPQTSLVPVPVPVPVHVPVPKDESKTWEKLPKQDEKAAALLSESSLPSDLDWVDGKLINHYEEMGLPGFTETAQVHPFDFTNSMADLAREKGVDIRLRAKVTKINHSKAGVRSIEYEDRDKAGEIRFIDDVTDVVIAAGPWTGKLLPRSKVEGLKSHSVVFDADVSPYAVFTEIQLPTDYVPEHRAARGQKRKHRGNVDPEIYARPGNEVYACGEHDWSTPLPETADLVQPDEVQCDDLIAYIGTVSPVLGAAPIKAKQACYLPRHVRFGEDRGPLIGQTTVPGLWVASGHTCWGIQNGPATGCLMSELLLDGATHSADIDKLHPKKFKV